MRLFGVRTRWAIPQIFFSKKDARCHCTVYDIVVYCSEHFEDICWFPGSRVYRNRCMQSEVKVKKTIIESLVFEMHMIII